MCDTQHVEAVLLRQLCCECSASAAPPSRSDVCIPPWRRPPWPLPPVADFQLRETAFNRREELLKNKDRELQARAHARPSVARAPPLCSRSKRRPHSKRARDAGCLTETRSAEQRLPLPQP